MNWLKTRNSPALGRVLERQRHAGQRVADVEHAAGLAARAVDGQRVAGDGLDAEAVQHRAEHAVVVEAGRQDGVEIGLLGRLAVDDALVQVGRAQSPDPAGEHDVVAVVHLGQVVEGAGLLGVGQHVGAALVGDLDEALFDVDVGVAVLPHRPELDEVDRRVDLGDGVHHVQRAHHVVDLRVDRVLAVDHGVGRRTLLAEVHDGVGLGLGDDAVGEGGVGEVPDPDVDGVSGDLLPARHPVRQRGDGDEAVDPHLTVVLAAHEVVDDGDLVADGPTGAGRWANRGSRLLREPESSSSPFAVLRLRFCYGVDVSLIMGQNPESSLCRGCNWRETRDFSLAAQPKSHGFRAMTSASRELRRRARARSRRRRAGQPGLAPQGLPQTRGPGDRPFDRGPDRAPRCRRGSAAPGRG